jgi:ribosomal protein S18 acetylase RimI-like enzyme
VAALGNIVTHPACRGQGLARAATAGLCRSLRESVDHIGLNVAADNVAAIRCYERLGFATIGHYGEFNLRAAAAAP